MEEKTSSDIHPNVWQLLSFATSEKNIAQEYKIYLKSSKRNWFAYWRDDEIAGCIGIEGLSQQRCEIKHIAVSPSHRREGIGSQMIRYVFDHCTCVSLFAETDKEAVQFYEQCGFIISSLGEKYPGVERFYCVLERH
ncbi:N-acetyltransferase [Pullulanibacillus camelliae]|uniref:N-acetyltransferase n=1 Tax=Pullulanibacillus camelliae TaxID=1707096 RepID=A0A8J3DZA3_9BACL|nr:GNAT family N-acetyltransferase [Pullulanibacillus camelliae]GGE51509.1 N-acetyltransferase [Pullulanibacillus camelliae]